MPHNPPFPCKHCGYTKLEIADRECGLDGVFYYQVFCPCCRASGPECRDEAEAVEKWDRVHGPFQRYVTPNRPLMAAMRHVTTFPALRVSSPTPSDSNKPGTVRDGHGNMSAGSFQP